MKNMASIRQKTENLIHATALVDPECELGKNVQIGPFCVVGPDVILEDGVQLLSHVYLVGKTKIGKNTRIYPFAAIGCAPQSAHYKGEKTEIIIGENNTIREHVTIHPGTIGGGGITRVGNNCFLMISSHIAHDCQIGNGVVMTNNATLGGHVIVGDFANIGGLSAVHQFVRIGKQAMIGGMSGVENDVIPYGSVMGNRARLSGLNIVGLKRRGFSRESIHSLRNAYRLLFAPEGTLAERIADVAALFKDHEVVMDIISFMQSDTDRSLCLPKDVT